MSEEKPSMEKHASWIVALVVGIAVGAVADHMIAGLAPLQQDAGGLHHRAVNNRVGLGTGAPRVFVGSGRKAPAQLTSTG